MTLRELNRALLARQMLLERSPLHPVEAVRRLVGLQAQQLRPPFLGLWTRLAGFESPILQEALEARRIVRATMMRATLHMVTAEDYLAFRQTMQPVLTAAMLSVVKSRGASLDVEAVVAAAQRAFRQTPQTFEQLRDRLLAEFAGLDERAMGYIARMRIPLVMVPGESESTFALAAEWLGQPVPGEERTADLILRYLAAFGPATAADAQAWIGLPKLKPVFDNLRPQLVTLSDEKGRELFDLPDAPRPGGDTPAPVRFLPGFDSAILGHADRTRIIADAHRPLVATKNLQVLPVFLVDGFAAGVWSMNQAKTRATLTVSPFAALSSRVRKEVEREAEAVLAFVASGAGTAEVVFAQA
ncbi:MAG: winged helix DNA-binding domain-containing protein [Bryobacteraceae bacterium]|nr:winged helix DNA-binding domain-containing protein [Bryobacteraceae bacterium]